MTRPVAASQWLAVLLWALGLALTGGGCDGDRSDQADVVLYTSIDEPVARQIIAAFEEQSGYTVRLVTDTEATRSVGLAERLRAEKNRPQADVWWGNEPFHTIALAEENLLASYESPAAVDIDPLFKDRQHRWAGNGLRARVLAVSDTLAADLLPDPGIEDLLRPEFRDRITIARPTTGTTGSHVAALYVLLGSDAADRFFRELRRNGVVLVGSNSQVAQQVGAGNFLIGVTDNDDIANARSAGGKLHQLLPDQGQRGMGTLTIPTTVGLVASRPDNQAARALIDFLLSGRTEQQLFEAKFAAYSVRAAEGQRVVESMDVDYAQVAAALPEAVRRATAILEGREP
jgi:iron(III) transport system substrate-binding protein